MTRWARPPSRRASPASPSAVTLFDYIATPAELDAAAATLFGLIAGGTLHIDIGQTLPLADVRKAHAALEHRATTGATVLIP
jgi:NADPH2:quinone reductase